MTPTPGSPPPHHPGNAPSQTYKIPLIFHINLSNLSKNDLKNINILPPPEIPPFLGLKMKKNTPGSPGVLIMACSS